MAQEEEWDYEIEDDLEDEAASNKPSGRVRRYGVGRGDA